MVFSALVISMKRTLRRTLVQLVLHAATKLTMLLSPGSNRW